MFEYTDPAGRNFLGRASVRTAYRQRIHGFYDRFARRSKSAFTWLEAFQNLVRGRAAGEQTVGWRAFPLLAAATDAGIDGDRFRLQDEYVEWLAETRRGGLTRVTFTTEFPESYEAFAEIGVAVLVDAVRDAIPGANPTPRELFGTPSDPDQLPPTARANLFRNHLEQNPWNNGRKGILCLTQQFNTLNALFNLATECGVRQSSGSTEDTCSLVGGACGPGRSSDPRVCSSAQRAVRNMVAFSLKDPVGVRMDTLQGSWKINDQDIDINDPDSNQGAWVISRNGRRAVLTVLNGLIIGDDPITTGAQISRLLTVSVDIVTAPESSLPSWARIGNEGQVRGTVPPG